MRISRDANDLVGKYTETFVREAIARATFERSEADGGGLGGEFLEVSCCVCSPRCQFSIETNTTIIGRRS